MGFSRQEYWSRWPFPSWIGCHVRYIFYFIPSSSVILFHDILIYYILCHPTLRYCFATAAKLLQSCPTLCDPIDGSLPGSPVPGILQARTLKWFAISLSNAWKWRVKVKLLSHVQLLATPWTAANQAPPSMEFSRQEYQSGVPLHSPKILFYNPLN